ncbi:unnamed protein product, partial [Adineta ricciae]
MIANPTDVHRTVLDHRQISFTMARIPIEVENEIDRFCNNVKQSTYTHSRDLALATILILKKLIGESKWANASELITLIRSYAHRIN